MATPAHAVNDPLGAVLQGPYAHLRGFVLPLAGAADGAVPVGTIVAADRLDDVLTRFAHRYKGADRRAVRSMWSQWYFSLVIPPVAGTALVHGLRRPLGLGDLRLRLADGGAPDILHLPPPEAVGLPDDPVARLEPLVREHLTPFIAAFAAGAGVTSRLLWSNAAIRIAAAVGVAFAGPAAAGPRTRLFERLFGARTWPDGERNPLHGGVRLPAGGEAPTPRLCCLACHLPGHGCCNGCPTPHAAPA